MDETMPGEYLWTFHDGKTDTTKNASKTYTIPGIYSVNLKVKNSCKVEHDTTHYIEVVDFPNTVVDISATAKDSIVCIGDRVMLINQKSMEQHKVDFLQIPF
ncbi:MAG: PKD domain-containing protein [Saprospiraceae bacterium]|nr:PKD domain-containing protein [Saprospiraceae bacterium]